MHGSSHIWRVREKNFVDETVFNFFSKTTQLKVHKHEIFFDFFCRNRNHMVPRAYNTIFLKIVYELAEIFDF
jgi:hypothetical protein